MVKKIIYLLGVFLGTFLVGYSLAGIYDSIVHQHNKKMQKPSAVHVEKRDEVPAIGEKSELLPPKEIHVCGETYRIKFLKQSILFDDGTVGLTDDDTTKKTIWLREHLSLQQDAEVLMHEIMHAVISTRVSDDNMTAHNFIYRLSPCLTQTLFRDNPELMAYMIAAAGSGPKRSNVWQDEDKDLGIVILPPPVAGRWTCVNNICTGDGGIKIQIITATAVSTLARPK